MVPTDPQPAGSSDPVSSAAWRLGDGLGLAAGFAVASAALAPAAVRAGAEGRAAPIALLVAALVWWAAVVVVVRSDLRDFIIPDGASLAIAGLGLAVAALVPWLSGEDLAEATVSVVGAAAVGAAGFGLFAFVGAVFRRMGRDALGFGDVKLAGACALWLTPADAALALEIAALGAIAVLLATRRRGRLRDTAVPFGAFMAPAAWIVFVLAPTFGGTTGLLPW